MADQETSIGLTPLHWSLYVALTTASGIFEIVILIYHCHKIYKHDIRNDADQQKCNEQTKSTLYKLTNILTVLYTFLYFITNQTGWMQVFGYCQSWGAVTYQLSKSLMYIIFLIRLHIIYNKSMYGYSPKMLIISCIFCLVTSIVCGVYGSLTSYEVYQYVVNIFGRNITSCVNNLRIAYILTIIIFDLFITIALLIAFINPLRKILRALQKYNSNHDLQRMKFPAIQLTSLTIIALVSSLLSHLIGVLLQTTAVYAIDISINIHKKKMKTIYKIQLMQMLRPIQKLKLILRIHILIQQQLD